MVNNALKVREMLAGKGIDVGVVDVLTLKPLDKDTILEQASKVKLMVSAENAQIIGGLGSAIAEVLAEEGCTCKFKRLGVEDQFGSVGTVDYLAKHYGLDADSLAAKICGALGK
jgi:transketolase